MPEGSCLQGDFPHAILSNLPLRVFELRDFDIHPPPGGGGCRWIKKAVNVITLTLMAVDKDTGGGGCPAVDKKKP